MTDELIKEILVFGKNLFNQFSMVSTPVGFFHGDDVNRPDRQFDCWVGHTNFEFVLLFYLHKKNPECYF